MFALSAAAKKAAASQAEASGDKEEGGEGQKKEGINGEVEEESNGKVKEGQGSACGSKLRACRRAAGEGSAAGTETIYLQFAQCTRFFVMEVVHEKSVSPHLTSLNSIFIYLLCFVSLKQLTVEGQEAPMEKRRLVRLKETQVPPALLWPRRLQGILSPGSLMTARSLRKEKRRRAVMKRCEESRRPE